jgi:predicted MFS family arabinose efflux permease
MLTAYRRAYELPGSWQFSSSAFVARLPIAMIGLGIVLLISDRTGSYAVAGVLSAIFQIAAAGGAIATSRWVDRLGQRRILPLLAMANGLGLVAFVVTVELALPFWVQAVAAALAGITQPAIGSLVRTRWAYVATQPAQLRSAFAIESILDEVIFTIGPLLTALLAFQVGLSLPLIVAAVLTVAGSLALSALRGSEPPATGRGATRDAEGPSALRRPGMSYMVIASLGVGAVFGTYELTVVAFTQEAGQSGASGMVLGLWAVGSFLGGLVFGSRQWAISLPRQVILLTGVLGLALLVAPLVRAVPVLAISAFVAGIAVAPALIAIFSLTERLVPSSQLTEGLTWTNSGLALGFSLGTAVNGVVIDAWGTTVGFLLPSACAALACVTAVLGRRTLTASEAETPSDRPAFSLNSDPVPGPAPGGVRDDPRGPASAVG